MNSDNKKKVLSMARKMHVKAIESGLESDFLFAAELFEKCGHDDDARICREDAAAVHEWTPDEILKREG